MAQSNKKYQKLEVRPTVRISMPDVVEPMDPQAIY